jgi:hypothetical protein
MKPYQHTPRQKYVGAGVYCFYPFDSPLKNNKGVFKLGMTTSFDKRTYAYHTYMPEGVYVVAMFRPSTRSKERREDEKGKEGLAKYYTRIERELFRDILNNGGEMVRMNVRKNDGRTEWVYANFDIIEDAFERFKLKYGGKLEIANLDHLPVPEVTPPYFKGTIKFF